MPLIALELVLGLGVPLAWGIWQLIDLRREREADRRAAARGGETGPEARPPDEASVPAASPAPPAGESDPG